MISDFYGLLPFTAFARLKKKTRKYRFIYMFSNTYFKKKYILEHT